MIGKILPDLQKVLDGNAGQITKIAFDYAVAAGMQKTGCMEAATEGDVCEKCKISSENLFFFSLVLGVAAEAARTNTWESLRDILTVFAKENFKDFPDLDFAKSEDFPSVISHR